MFYFPEELMNDVLLKSPVKSLLRLRSVKKSWRDLIDDPDFIKKHMEQSMKKGSSVEVIHRCDINKFYSMHLDLSGNPITDPEELPHPFGYRYDFDKSVVYTGDYEIHLVGSCNGLVCFVDSAHRIILWNLATRKYFELQHLDIELPRFTDLDLTYYVNYGFGYDGATDDYKVIRLINSYHNESDCFLVEFYSLKSKSWKRFEDLVSRTRSDHYGILVGGSLHWLTYETKWDDDESPIVAFDLTMEEFNLVPCLHLPGKIASMNLGTFQGCLSLFCHYHEAGGELWVMKDYGVKESWTKVYTNNKTSIRYMRAIDHSILEVNKKRLKWYNSLQENCLKKIKICSATKGCLEACVHYESLVGME
ncbi:F-box protein CPR30 [Abeliophyllum distichum]|uniref:F-box protein CPR30 n=1 Tax=Abeliophyllum distichum TaxID=126358 RepID=A0ABD1V966_9LAMI